MYLFLGDIWEQEGLGQDIYWFSYEKKSVYQQLDTFPKKKNFTIENVY